MTDNMERAAGLDEFLHPDNPGRCFKPTCDCGSSGFVDPGGCVIVCCTCAALFRVVSSEAIVVAGLPDRTLVALAQWVAIDYRPDPPDLAGHEMLLRSVLHEAQNRKWPEGWWEDPSVIPALFEALADATPPEPAAPSDPE